MDLAPGHLYEALVKPLPPMTTETALLLFLVCDTAREGFPLKFAPLGAGCISYDKALSHQGSRSLRLLNSAFISARLCMVSYTR